MSNAGRSLAENARAAMSAPSRLVARYLDLATMRRAVTGGVVVGLLSLPLPKRYVAQGSFLPDVQERSPLSPGLVGLASQFNLGSLFSSRQGPEFYGDLVKSRTVLDELALSPLPSSGTGGPTTLTAWYGFDDEPAPKAESDTRRRLEGSLNVQVNAITSVVRIRFSIRDPVLAAAAVNRLIEIVNDFNLVTYRSRARARREFTEKRV